MFNANTVKSELISLIGWKKSNNPSQSDNPMGDLLTASSGQYYNDHHPLLTVENLKSIADTFSNYTYPAHDSEATYDLGDVVTDSGKYYASVVNSNTGNAVSSEAHWRETNPFNEWLRVRTQAGIIETINDWIALKFERKTAANLLSRAQVVNPPGTKALPVGDTKRYVCWSVVPSPLLDIILTIDRASIQMVNSEETIIYFFKNGSDTPTDQITIDGDATNAVQWIETGWELERGNFYYIAVDRDSIDAEPINALAGMDVTGTYNRFPGTLPYAEVAAFEHDGPGNDGWSDVQNILTNRNNYGLNLQISARCDYTNFIIDQSRLFINAFCKRVAMNMLRELAYNATAKINRAELNVPREALWIEIDGPPYPGGHHAGIKKQYLDALKAITFDSRSLSKDCLPCKTSKLQIS